jgi:hypothetical protein
MESVKMKKIAFYIYIAGVFITIPFAPKIYPFVWPIYWTVRWIAN